MSGGPACVQGAQARVLTCLAHTACLARGKGPVGPWTGGRCGDKGFNGRGNGGKTLNGRGATAVRPLTGGGKRR